MMKPACEKSLIGRKLAIAAGGLVGKRREGSFLLLLRGNLNPREEPKVVTTVSLEVSLYPPCYLKELNEQW